MKNPKISILLINFFHIHVNVEPLPKLYGIRSDANKCFPEFVGILLVFISFTCFLDNPMHWINLGNHSH